MEEKEGKEKIGDAVAIRTVSLQQPEYPSLLREIAEPPERLYYIGNLDLLNRPCAAVVGTRRANSYGLWAAEELGKKLGRCGITVISGMAKGIDAAAHRGALEQGSTTAVLGCGIDQCYPAVNRALRDRIARQGLILSEYPPGTPPMKYRFPRRNRIISGISQAVVVVQAGNSSGALITAEMAAEQGRTVYAVPGNINSAVNLGNNKLIRDGAVALVILDDLLDDLGVGRPMPEEWEGALGEEERRICSLLQQGGEKTVDELCRETGYAPSKVNGIVTVLEIKGILFTALGKVFIAK